MTRIAIIGAGPTGLGAAHRLAELGHDEHVVFERRAAPGGLASSYVDPQGFTWDVGGHVQFSHYDHYDRILDDAVAGGWLHHERESWVWIRNRFVPYPFQANIHRLDPDDCEAALDGLRAAAGREPAPPRHLLDWIHSVFGSGVAELFMVPYNEKVWGYPLDTLDAGWIADRVAVPDLARIEESVRLRRDEVSWGPNRTFRFPLRGGTGAIWQGVARLLNPERIRYRAPVSSIDPKGRALELEDGTRHAWDALISTMPLDVLCRIVAGPARLQQLGSRLVWGTTHVVGVGLRGGRPESTARKCWMYFPEPASPYYRVTVFSNYSPNNVPEGEGYWSLMAEVTESPHRPVEAETLRDQVLQAMKRDRLIEPGAEVVSYWHHRAPHGYPTPFLGRDAVLEAIEEILTPWDIYSRGRFGAWRYEVSNQDHSFMQGVEVVDRLLADGDEPTLRRPDAVNRGEFREG